MLGDSAQFPIAFDDTRSQQDRLSSDEALKEVRAILDPCFQQGGPQGPKGRSSSSALIFTNSNQVTMICLLLH